MRRLVRSAKFIVVKSYRVCRVVLQAIFALIFLCWAELKNKINNLIYVEPRMSRQMGYPVSKLNKHKSKERESNDQGLLKQIEELLQKNGKLEGEVDTLRMKVDEQNEMIEKQLGKDIERTTKGRCNNASDSAQPTSLSQKFKAMYDGEWLSVMRCFFRGDKELLGIRFLSKILEDCQLFCQTKAREQLLKFVNLDSEETTIKLEDVINSIDDLHDLYKLRRIIGLHAPNKENVIKMFAKKCEESENYREITEDAKDDTEAIETLRDYVKKSCDLCWQCAISDPPVLLKFDVRGKNIVDVNDQFQEYHYSGEINERGSRDHVMQVVWPAVVINDDAIGDETCEILLENAKGHVIVHASSSV